MNDRSASSPKAGAAPVRAARGSGRGGRRQHLNGRYLALSWQREPSAPTKHRPDRPMISVPKRIVPSAPVRNAIRRVIREAWRLARVQSARSDGPVQDALPRADDGLPRWPVCLIRLHALPLIEGGMPAPDPADKPKANRRKPKPFDFRLPDGALKRACRQDADVLVERFMRAAGPGGRGAASRSTAADGAARRDAP